MFIYILIFDKIQVPKIVHCNEHWLMDVFSYHLERDAIYL